MAASSSRQTHDIPLHVTTANVVKQRAKTTSRKGKGRAKVFSAPLKGHVGQSTGYAWDDTESDSPWEWKSLTDSSASKVPLNFTKDGVYFFSLVGSSVKIHSVATGQVVSTLSSPAPSGKGTSSDRITSAIINPCNAFQLITGSLDGRLMVWDFLDAALLQVIDIAQPIYYICVHERFRESVFVAASQPNKKAKNKDTDDNAVVLRVSLKPADNSTASVSHKSAEILPIGKTRFPTGLTFSASGAWLIATAGHKVHVAMSSSFSLGFTKYTSPERLTCLASHPSEDYFATGDEKGNIRLWYCLNDNIGVKAREVEKKAQTTMLHWHAHAVSSIAFTSNGAYLLSGGEEGVLVIWQLHTGKKEFVPRVGAPIKTVALSQVGSSEEEYLLCLADKTHLFINAGTLKISRSYSGIKLDPDSWPSTSTMTLIPLAVHSLTSTLILPASHPSSLQLYSPSSSKLISELEISPSNRISRRDEKPIEPSRVEEAVVSATGEWMATIDTRQGDESFRGEIYLKIWWWDQKTGFWILNTRVDRPHGMMKVTCIVFSPTRLGQSIHLVTAGEDGDIKMWGLKLTKVSGMTEECWVTRSTSSFRSEIPRSASWSPDASLLAISLGPYVCMYDPMTNVHRQTLLFPECKAIDSAHFVGRGRYLAVAGQYNIVLWELVSHSVRWHYASSSAIDTVVCHPQEDTFAVFYRQSPSGEDQVTRVYLFHATSSTPYSTHSLPFQLRKVAWYSAVREPSKFAFVGITQSWSVVLFGHHVRLPEEPGSMDREIHTDLSAVRRTLFLDIFGKSAFSDTPTVSSQPHFTAGPWTGKERLPGDIFDSPVYLIPPLERLFDPLMNKLLRPRPQEQLDLTLIDKDHNNLAMDEEIPGTTIAGNRQARVPGKEEMNTFIDLFKKHSVKSNPPPSFLNSNGISKDKVNGNIPHSPSPAVVTSKTNGTTRSKGSTPSRVSSANPISPSPMMNGKKRKNG